MICFKLCVVVLLYDLCWNPSRPMQLCLFTLNVYLNLSIKYVLLLLTEWLSYNGHVPLACKIASFQYKNSTTDAVNTSQNFSICRSSNPISSQHNCKYNLFPNVYCSTSMPPGFNRLTAVAERSWTDGYDARMYMESRFPRRDRPRRAALGAGGTIASTGGGACGNPRARKARVEAIWMVRGTRNGE